MSNNGGGNGQTSGRRRGDNPGKFDKAVKKGVQGTDCLLPVIRMFLLLSYLTLWILSIRNRRG